MAQTGNAFPNCILLKYNGVHYDVYQPISKNDCKTATFSSEHAAKEIEKSFSSSPPPRFSIVVEFLLIQPCESKERSQLL